MIHKTDSLVHNGAKDEICEERNAEILTLYSSEFNDVVSENPIGEGNLQLGTRYIMDEAESPFWFYTTRKASCPFVRIEGPAFFSSN